ncbi:MAG: hypothetical protein B9S38_11060 [Verrucomicrobiia bacterium Tous-C4TDCM]|nr:MAG: hypothetical protein B9S38_11060 [Verrucomicrobiae bacterium Tous-C4TDCM]
MAVFERDSWGSSEHSAIPSALIATAHFELWSRRQPYEVNGGNFIYEVSNLILQSAKPCFDVFLEIQTTLVFD